MSLSAEVQWSLLPPMTMITPQVALAGILEPAYDVAGDSFAFGNPFSIRDGRQYTPLTPRTIVTSLRFDW